MATDRVVVQGSLRPFLAAAATVAGLGPLGVVAWRAGGAAPGTLVVLGLAVLAVVVLLVDLPRRTELGPEGVVRVCVVRRESIAWDRIVAVERQRRRLAGPGTGGLVLRGRRGRWLLTTSAEPPTIHAAIARLLVEHAPAVRMQAEPPRVTTDRR